VHRTDDVHDQLRPRVCTDRRDRHRSGLGGRARAHEMTPREHEHDRQEQRAGDETPTCGREGVQHVVNCGNNVVTRGRPKWIETVSTKNT
jgi:hypothetical protein